MLGIDNRDRVAIFIAIPERHFTISVFIDRISQGTYMGKSQNIPYIRL